MFCVPTGGTQEQRLAKGVQAVVRDILPRQMTREKKARMVLNSVKDGSLFGVDGQQQVKDMVTEMGRDIHQPYRVAWTMAENPSLSGNNVEQLRAVQKPGFMDRVMMPSKSAVLRENYDLERWAEDYFSLKVMAIPSTVPGKKAEGYGFDIDRLVRFMIKKFGLEEIAKTQSIEIKITYDGAQLTKNKGHIALGFQITDPCATNPKMPEKFLYLNENGEMMAFQSRNNVVIARIHMMSETEENVDFAFADVYKYADKTGREGLPALSPEWPAIFPIRWVGCHDKSAAQKIGKCGGGCYNKVLFCTMCECTKHDLYDFNMGELRCERCKSKGREKCRHWSVNDQEEINEKELHLSLLLEESEKNKQQQTSFDSDSEEDATINTAPHQTVPFEDLIDKVQHQEETLETKSNIMYRQGSASPEINPAHIEFQPQSTEESDKFQTLLLQELELRDMLPENIETREELRARLKARLTMGIRVRRLRRAVQRYRNRQELMEVEKLILCVMHAENRITEKVIATLLYLGFEEPYRTPSEYTKYKKDVEDVVNRSIFHHVGSDTDGQWEFPKPDAKKSAGAKTKLMGDVKLTNEKARLFLSNIEVLLPTCLIGRDESEISKWKNAIQLCRDCMEWLRKRENFTDSEIVEFQDTADNFIELWIDLNRSQSMTNYLHDLAAGHFSYYLRKYRNLYRYSQQG
jgi:hypothetical protein